MTIDNKTGVNNSIASSSDSYHGDQSNSSNNRLYGYYQNTDHMMSSIRSLKKQLASEKNDNRLARNNVKMLAKKTEKLQKADLDSREALLAERAKVADLEHKLRLVTLERDEMKNERDQYKTNFCYYANEYVHSVYLSVYRLLTLSLNMYVSNSHTI